MDHELLRSQKKEAEKIISAVELGLESFLRAVELCHESLMDGKTSSVQCNCKVNASSIF